MILADAQYPDMSGITPTRALLLPPLYLLHLACFVAPGLGVARAWVRRGWLPSPLTMPAALVASCALGYVVFWAYFASPALGWTAGIIVSSLALLLLLPHRGNGMAAAPAEVRTQLALMAAVGFFYVVSDYTVLGPGRADLGQIRYRFADRELFYDCYFPFFFAQVLHDGKGLGDGPTRTPLFNHWRSSDRPPLQTGLFLMQSWLWERGYPPWLHYHLVGAAVQSCWVPAVWTLCRLLRLRRRHCGVVVLFVAFTGFALLNTLYCWPKMLAGALTVFALAALLSAARAAPRLPAGLLAGGSAALALLAHGAAAFTLLALALFALTPRLFPGWRASLAGAALAAALLAPWLAYQTWYDPPGDRMPKWHLAGLHDIDEPPRTFRQALIDRYREPTLAELAQRRLRNVAALFVDVEVVPPEEAAHFGETLRPGVAALPLVRFRDAQLHQLFPMLLLLNLGWPALVLRWRRGDPEARLERLLLGLAGTSIVLWILLIYSGGTTVLHHASYADVLVLMALLSAALCHWGNDAVYLVLALHTVVFLVAWLFTTPTFAGGQPNPAMVPVAAAAFVVLVGVALGGWDLWLHRQLRRTRLAASLWRALAKARG
jgi:hypothetical protein